MRRCLLIQHKAAKAKDGQSSEDREIAGTKTMRELAAHTVAQLQARKVSDVEVIASSKINADALGAFITGFDLSNYEWKQKGDVEEDEKDAEKGEEEVDERTKRKEKTLDNFTISHEQDLGKNDSCIYNTITAEATKYARGLANTRGTQADPAWMEQQVRDLLEGAKCDNVKEVRCLRGQDLQDLGMNLFYSVGKAAVSEPRCVVVHYQGNAESNDVDLALVGKGVTFDTGGLNLKPTGYMEDMYGDKNGACAVLGALHGTLKLKPKKNIVFAVGLAENAIDSKSYKPGDIIKSMKGFTVEIGNTDAEGRLVLADTLTYV